MSRGPSGRAEGRAIDALGARFLSGGRAGGRGGGRCGKKREGSEAAGDEEEGVAGAAEGGGGQPTGRGRVGVGVLLLDPRGGPLLPRALAAEPHPQPQVRTQPPAVGRTHTTLEPASP